MQQRYYDPQIGRFLSKDPVSTNPSTGDMFNRYSYANNNPYRFTDPDGRISREVKKQGYVDLGDGYVARVDKVTEGGSAKFEIHIYKSDAKFERMAESKNTDGLRAREVNTLKTDGTWGKHGKDGQIESRSAKENLSGLVDKQMQRHGLVHNLDGRYVPRASGLGKLLVFAGAIGMGGALLDAATPSPIIGCRDGGASQSENSGVCN